MKNQVDPQIRALSDLADVTVADHTRHESMEEIAKAILAVAPPRFAVAGLSMGGYIAYEIIRRCDGRTVGGIVAELALAFEAGEDEIATDVLNLIDDLRARGVLAL